MNIFRKQQKNALQVSITFGLFQVDAIKKEFQRYKRSSDVSASTNSQRKDCKSPTWSTSVRQLVPDVGGCAILQIVSDGLLDFSFITTSV